MMLYSRQLENAGPGIMQQATLSVPTESDFKTFPDIREHIARIPRVSLIAKPTPLTEAPNLARALCGKDAPRIFIKRDDLTSIALGGNKLRNLEFRLAAPWRRSRTRSSSDSTCNRTPPDRRWALATSSVCERSSCSRATSRTTFRATC